MRKARRARAAHEVPRRPKVERRHSEPRPPEVFAHQERRRRGGADGCRDEPLRGADAGGARVERRQEDSVHGEAVYVGVHDSYVCNERLAQSTFRPCLVFVSVLLRPTVYAATA